MREPALAILHYAVTAYTQLNNVGEKRRAAEASVKLKTKLKKRQNADVGGSEEVKVFGTPSNLTGIPSESKQDELKCRTVEASQYHQSRY